MTDSFDTRVPVDNFLTNNTDVVKIEGAVAVADAADMVAALLGDIAANTDFWDHTDSGSAASFIILEDVWLEVDVMLVQTAGELTYEAANKKLERLLASSLTFTFTNNLTGDDLVSVSANGELLLKPRSIKSIRFADDDVAKVEIAKNATAATLTMTEGGVSGFTVNYEVRLHLGWRE